MTLFILRNSHERLTLIWVARWFDRDPTTVDRRLAAAEFPSFTPLLRYGCLLHAEELLQRHAYSREEIARRLGRPSAASVRELRVRHQHALGRDEALMRIVQLVESRDAPN